MYFIQNVELGSSFPKTKPSCFELSLLRNAQLHWLNYFIPRSPFPAAPLGLGRSVCLSFLSSFNFQLFLPLIFFVSFLSFAYGSFGVWPGLWPAYDWTWKNIKSISESFKWRHEIKILKKKGTIKVGIVFGKNEIQ